MLHKPEYFIGRGDRIFCKKVSDSDGFVFNDEPTLLDDISYTAYDRICSGTEIECNLELYQWVERNKFMLICFRLAPREIVMVKSGEKEEEFTRLIRITARGVLSYNEAVQISLEDDNVAILLGQGDSGKTNLFRLICHATADCSNPLQISEIGFNGQNCQLPLLELEFSIRSMFRDHIYGRILKGLTSRFEEVAKYLDGLQYFLNRKEEDKMNLLRDTSLVSHVILRYLPSPDYKELWPQIVLSNVRYYPRSDFVLWEYSNTGETVNIAELQSLTNLSSIEKMV